MRLWWVSMSLFMELAGEQGKVVTSCSTGIPHWEMRLERSAGSVKAMHKKRHVDNHIEYLQGKRTYAETYEAPPKAHAYVEPWHDAKFAHMQTKEH